MSRTYLLLLFGLNLLLTVFIIITFDQTSLSIYAQKLDINDTDILISSPTKANATEGTAIKTNFIKRVTDKELKYCYKSQFGSLGNDDGQFNRPHDIVFDSKSFLYINARELNTFQKFSPDGKFISQLGEKDEDLGQYRSP